MASLLFNTLWMLFEGMRWAKRVAREMVIAAENPDIVVDEPRQLRSRPN